MKNSCFSERQVVQVCKYYGGREIPAPFLLVATLRFNNYVLAYMEYSNMDFSPLVKWKYIHIPRLNTFSTERLMIVKLWTEFRIEIQ